MQLPQYPKYCKTKDLVISLLERYTEKGCIVLITIPLLTCFMIYCPKIQLLVAQYVFAESAFPKNSCTTKLKKQGEHYILTFSDKLAAIKFLDQKHVTLLSTAFNYALTDTGKKQGKTTEPTKKHNTVYQYNCYMGCVD